MSNVYLMMAEHFAVPGLVVRVCATRARAVSEAIACVNVMLKDNGDKRIATEAEMEAALELLQDEHGAAHCYAEISQHEVV